MEKSHAQLQQELAEARQQIQTLQAREQQARHLFDSLPDAVLVSNPQGVILEVNPAACLLYGIPRNELMGRTLFDLTPPKQQADLRQAFEQMLAGAVAYFEGVGWSSDERAIPVEIRAKRIEHLGRTALLLYIRDITIRKQNEATLQRQNQYLAALHETTLGLISHLNLAELLQTLIQRVAALMHTSHGFVALPSADGQTLEIQVGLGLYERFIGFKMRPGEGVAGTIWQTKQPLTVTDYDAWPQRAMTLPRGTIRALTAVPIAHSTIYQVETLGVLGVARGMETTEPFDEDALDLMNRFAQLASVTIDHAGLFQQAERRASEMATLVKIGQEISASLDLTVVLGRIAPSIKELLQATLTAVYLKIPNQPDFKAIVALGRYATEIMADTIRLGEGVIGHIAQTQQPELIRNIYADPRSVTIPGTEDSPDEPESMICTPLLSRGELIGVMALWRPHTIGVFSQNDFDFVIGIARQAAIAIDNAQLFRKVQRENRYFETMVKNSPVAIASMDLDYTIISWNPAAERMFGYTVQEVVGQDPHELLSVADTDDMVMVGDTVRTISRCRRKDGSLLDVESFDVPVIVDGEVIALFVMYHDISQIQEGRRQAEAAQEAMSAFLASVSHELRTPLTSVLGFAKLIQKRFEQRILPAIQTNDSKTQKVVTQVQDNLTIILSEGERLTALINDVLDLAKIEAGKVEWQQQTLHIGEVIDQAMTTMLPLFTEKRLPLHKHIEPALPLIEGDRNKLVQVMINLFSNAIKFTEQGSVTCKARQQGEEIIISVIDTGIGIPTYQRAVIFEKFKQLGDTLTNKPEGTGLGLPICREIVSHHHGRIWVESEVGQGSTFSFSLPIVAR